MYDDGGLSGGTMERPALKRLLEDIKASKVQTVVVYKVDRLTRSLSDFAKIVDVLDAHNASFVSVTQQFNTTTSMGRLTGSTMRARHSPRFERPRSRASGERIRDQCRRLFGRSRLGFFGRGVWIDQPITFNASQPRCGATDVRPSSLAIQAATLLLDHNPPSAGGSRSRSRASQTQGHVDGCNVPLGYDVKDRKLVVNEPEASTGRCGHHRDWRSGKTDACRALARSCRDPPSTHD